MSALDAALWTPGDDYTIALFYRYVEIADPAALVEHLRFSCEKFGLMGRILVSSEGINGTLAGGVAAIDAFVADLTADSRFTNIDWKFTADRGESLPFLGLSIRVVDEIIASGRAASFIKENISFDDATYGGITGTGTHLTPTEFHSALARKDGIVLDIRNEFEFDIGHFKGSKNLKTFNYAETFDALDQILGPVLTMETKSESTAENVNENTSPEQNIYMYCTGGIRCEKASAYLCAKGFTNVYQLEGGIHRYLETYPDGGLFQGKNFVFDSRVSVGPTASASAESSTSKNAEEDLQNIKDREGVEVVAADGAESAESSAVVGRCIDCSCLHDVYSGFIVCTVCRMPVLVCPSCVQSNPAQGEYHCSRHRDLKKLYFTVLTPFNLAELQTQLSGLQVLLKESAGHLEQVRKAERLQRAQQQQLSHNKRKAEQSSDLQDSNVEHKSSEPKLATITTNTVESGTMRTGEPTSSEVEELSTGAQLGKARRRTLRKQIDRVEARIKALQDAASADQEAAGPAEVGAEGSVNPKTRGGWGFWKT